MECKNCKGTDCIKKVIRKEKQKYYCRTCKKYFQSVYAYRKCTTEDEEMIVRLTTEGVGICGISRITEVSKGNIINKIKVISRRIERSALDETAQEYEVDEVYTYIGNKNAPCYNKSIEL